MSGVVTRKTLILTSFAKRRLSKDDPVGEKVRAPSSVLRQAQDEGVGRLGSYAREREGGGSGPQGGSGRAET